VTILDLVTRHTLTQTFDTGEADGGVVRTTMDTVANLDADSTPAVTEGGFFQQLMTAGAATVDLTNLTDVRGRAVNLNALKPRSIKIKALDANAGAVTIAKGASNGYTGFGSNFSLTLPAGGEVELYFGSAGTAVSGTVKTLDLSGTGTDGVQISLSAGA